jgi:hypothetical protein
MITILPLYTESFIISLKLVDFHLLEIFSHRYIKKITIFPTVLDGTLVSFHAWSDTEWNGKTTVSFSAEQLENLTK